MLRAGGIALSIWSGVNLLLAGAILISMTMFGKNAPGLRILFDEASVRGLDPRALATVNAIAVLFNACAVAFCLLMLYVTWSGVAAGSKAAYWALVVASGSLQVFGFVSRRLFGRAQPPCECHLVGRPSGRSRPVGARDVPWSGGLTRACSGLAHRLRLFARR